MNEVIYKQGENKVPIKSWATDIEENAMKQAVNLSNLPFVFKHVALMADAHSGYGMCIGGVLTTKGYIIPNAVGKDIGCSVSAYKTNLNIKDLSIEKLKEIMGEIRKELPFGEGQYPTADLELVEYLETLEKEIKNGK